MCPSNSNKNADLTNDTSVVTAGMVKRRRVWLTAWGRVLSNDTFIHLTENKQRMDFSGDIWEALCEKGPLLTEGRCCFPSYESFKWNLLKTTCNGILSLMPNVNFSNRHHSDTWSALVSHLDPVPVTAWHRIRVMRRLAPCAAVRQSRCVVDLFISKTQRIKLSSGILN